MPVPAWDIGLKQSDDVMIQLLCFSLLGNVINPTLDSVSPVNVMATTSDCDVVKPVDDELSSVDVICHADPLVW
jgi:hypothetical protein